MKLNFRSIPVINKKRRVPVSVPWYLAGGVDPSNCVAAYQAKGAADYATSKVNLANPGTHDLTEPSLGGNYVTPTWSVDTGWAFNSFGLTKATVFETGITPTNAYTSIIKYSTSTIEQYYFLFGNLTGEAKQYAIMACIGYSDYYFNNGGALTVSEDSPLDGTLAIAGPKAYANGIYKGAISVDTLPPTSMYIGDAKDVLGLFPQSGFTGNVQAFSTYSATLTAEQVLAIHNSMMAL